MATTSKQNDSKRSAVKASRQPAAPVAEAAQVSSMDGPAAPRPGVKPAYLTYLSARKGLATAFRGRQLRDKEVYEDAQECYQAYQQAIDNAVQAREKAEREALGLYRGTVESAVEKASQEYRERMRQASVQCKKATDDAWKASMETSATMAGIFENDEVLPERVEAPEGGSGPESLAGRAGSVLLAAKRGYTSLARRSTGAVKRLMLGNGKRTKESAVDAHS
jgi:hypothetical protein